MKCDSPQSYCKHRDWAERQRVSLHSPGTRTCVIGHFCATSLIRWQNSIRLVCLALAFCSLQRRGDVLQAVVGFAVDRARAVPYYSVDWGSPQAGGAIDQGDILIDGGNSFFLDTERRARELDAVGLRFLGTGVSGGEKGALTGPAIMPGGVLGAYQQVEPIFVSIAAQVPDGPCCAYMGPGGAGQVGYQGKADHIDDEDTDRRRRGSGAAEPLDLRQARGEGQGCLRLP